MKHLKRSTILMILLTVIASSRTIAQDYFASLNPMNQLNETPRAKEVLQDNEYTSTGIEQGDFYNHPLMLNGRPLDYNIFQLSIEGALSVVKGAPVTGRTIRVPFFIYLRRDGNRILIPGKEMPDAKQFEVELSEIMKNAKPGDDVVIEAVNKEDGLIKRILRIPDGC